MGKHGSTKDKIVKLISQGENTLSGISRSLNLSPSTVSKHIHDLEMRGVIELKENEHIRKWKYYKVSGGVGGELRPASWPTQMRGDRIIPIAIIVVLAVAAVFIYSHSQGAGAASTYVPISITDPPQVPYGTQALYINYTSLVVGVQGQNGTHRWVQVNSGGRLDLMSLINESQLVGGVNISPDSKIDYAEFNVTSASILIDNTSYPVNIINNQVVAGVENDGALNSSSGILLDFAPVVNEMYMQNSTYFVMLPSLRALVVPDHDVGYVGHASGQWNMHPLLPNYMSMFSGISSNIIISNPAVQFGANSVSIGMTVSNVGYKNVTVMGVFIRSENKTDGNWTLGQKGNWSINSSGIYVMRTRGFMQQGSPGQWQGRAKFLVYRQLNNSTAIQINGSAIHQLSAYGAKPIVITLPKPISNIIIYGYGNWNAPAPPVQELGFGYGFGIGLQVDSNGTMLPPEPWMQQNASIGYDLVPNSRVELAYNGSLPVQAQAGLEGNGTIYNIMVLTNYGIVQENVTSS